jgi:hypothetical protein
MNNEGFIRIEDMALPEIIDKRSSTLDIMKETKRIITDNSKFNSFMRIIQDSNPNKRRKANDTMYKLPDMFSMSRFSRIHLTQSLTKNYSVRTEPELLITEINSSAQRPKLKNFIFEVDKTAEDNFGSLFYEFLGLEESDFLPSEKIKYEEFCTNEIEKLMSDISSNSCLKKTFYSKKNEIDLKLTSYCFVLENEKVKKKVYLPLDFNIIFSFCTTEQVIFVISQCIENNEDEKNLTMNKDKVLSVLKTMPYFSSETTDFSQKFKMNKNIKFDWFSDNSAYTATLICPKISFYIANKNISINKYLTIDLFIQIYSDYKNWDTTVLQYLRFDKNFRAAFSRVVCNKVEMQKRGQKIKIKIDKRFIINELHSLEISSILLVYQQTTEINNFISFESFCIESNKFDKVHYNMTWRNTLTLLRLRNKINLENFINRKTNLDKEGKIHFDKTSIDFIDNELIKYFSKSISDYKPKLLFNLLYPRVISQTIINGRMNRKKLDIPSQYINDIEKFEDLKKIIGYFSKHLRNFINMIFIEDSN